MCQICKSRNVYVSIIYVTTNQVECQVDIFYKGVVLMEQRNEEWKREQSRIEMIQQVIKAKLEKLQEHMGGLKEGVIELRRDFWKDVTINLDHPDDVIETFTSIKQQAELLAEQERNHRQSYQKVQQLLRLNQSPYFGRIDFQEEGEQGAEQIYIGITSLMDQEDEDFLIFDWRAPISSLYYDHSPGPASYLTPSGEIKGNIELKRQYIIKGSKLKGMFDTGVTIGDQLLQGGPIIAGSIRGNSKYTNEKYCGDDPTGTKPHY